ncbi:hypothetical protein OZX69_09710 (plasmid) [Lactobacillus sp. ESL0731]|uniref:hypothetical protein n=1 Tax=unclassified Lactobacillus TaxID=2620435 RepID=UPI0023F7857F|nr:MULTISPECIES: hypothetical protein [unclassified Lactobacillus]WEV52081.1 hypothetical protein OZX63_09615 [Lactobacillus sp. ESL0700]WEV63228.1 hypothetical protein OZX69_09710 [Lactobacillus sp. ESL0731]
MTDLVPVWLVAVAFCFFAVRLTIFDQIGSIAILFDVIGLFCFTFLGFVLLCSFMK